MKGISQQLQFNYYCGLFIIPFICPCRDLNLRLMLCAAIKFKTKLKAAQLANFSFMSRHIIVCRDISNCGRISYPQAATSGISLHC